MTTSEIANGLVNFCRAGQYEQAIRTYYDANIVSVEPMGDPATMTGIDATLGKLQWFMSSMEVHNTEIDGPYVNGSQFAVRFTLDATDKSKGERNTMVEVGLYTVENDKIVKEVFFFGS